MKGKVDSRYRLTIPVEARKAIGLRPGDEVRFDISEGKLNVSVVRPRIGEVLDRLLSEHDTKVLHQETGGDAIGFVRESRGWNSLD